MKYKNKKLKITCDGGAATGKSTGAKMIAKRYGLAFLSSGLLYRYAAYLLIKFKPKNKILFLRKKFKNLNYHKLHAISLHTPKISAYTSSIAKKASLRNILKTYQQNFVTKNAGCVLEGRDASTKILPKSDVKFYFICNTTTAAKRRYKELKKRAQNVSFKEIKRDIYARDRSDRQRAISPLQRHPLAIIVNTGKMNKQAMVSFMSKHVEKVLKIKYGN